MKRMMHYMQKETKCVKETEKFGHDLQGIAFAHLNVSIHFSGTP